MKISAKAKVQNETKGALTANGLLSAASSSTIDRSYCSLSGSTLLLAEKVSTSGGCKPCARQRHGVERCEDG